MSNGISTVATKAKINDIYKLDDFYTCRHWSKITEVFIKYDKDDKYSAHRQKCTKALLGKSYRYQFV